jgi:NAD(P)-dependent dehydrogenase (short-subunit alcohol dehydrogenase family)
MSVVLVTGCSRGIGLQAALEFGRNGHNVFASMRNTSISGDLEKAVREEELRIEIVQLDVTDDNSVRTAVEKVLAATGRIDVLVNNAGFGLGFGPIEETNIQEAHLVFETNFFGPLRLMQAVLPAMREQGSGAIVSVSSLAGVIAEPFNGVYAASKHALEAACEVLHYECHPFGIRVAMIEPGGHDTRGYWRAREELCFAKDSPYLDLGLRYMEAVKRLSGTEEPGNPRAVAEAIYNAAYTDQPTLRYPVGAEAHVASLRRQLSDEEFERAMRETLGIWD